jgi:putative membrane protein
MLFVWLKALHIVTVVAWMAGLFYLPRLFVYHAKIGISRETSETFKIMERRLLKAIMNPAMILTWITGLILAYLLGQFSSDVAIWFLVKFVLVILLTVFHMYLGRYLKAFEADNNEKTQNFFRVVNEVPTLLLIGIVIMVVVQPF